MKMKNQKANHGKNFEYIGVINLENKASGIKNYRIHSFSQFKVYTCCIFDSLLTLLDMNCVLYYAKKSLFGLLMVATFYAILYQKDGLEILLVQNSGVLPLLSRFFLEIMPNSHIAECFAAWLLFILGFLLYTKVCKISDGLLISLALIVIYIWATIAVSLPLRKMLTGFEDHGTTGNVVWVIVLLICITRICFVRYRKNNSFKSILA